MTICPNCGNQVGISFMTHAPGQWTKDTGQELICRNCKWAIQDEMDAEKKREKEEK